MSSGADGSSPLTRGKRARRSSRPGLAGLIPAHAGKTRAPWARAHATWAHPRSRGENGYPVDRIASTMGSSPLTRGKQTGVEAANQESRLIPAHAGKTRGVCLVRRASRAHPRSRGENLRREGVLRVAHGSSPLTRGKPVHRVDAELLGGLIPAHAGKTPTALTVSSRDSAHPRSRGENTRTVTASPPRRGSSPLTRGKRPGWARRGCARGLIPAHAGKTPA